MGPRGLGAHVMGCVLVLPLPACWPVKDGPLEKATKENKDAHTSGVAEPS